MTNLRFFAPLAVALLIVSLLPVPTLARRTVTLVATCATAATADGVSAFTTTSKNWAGADLITAEVAFYSVPTPDASHITDSNTNTYTATTAQVASDTSLKVLTYYKISPTTDGTDTVTFTPAGGAGLFSSMSVCAFEFGGTPTFSAQVGSATAQAGSIGASGDLVVEGTAFDAGDISSIDGSFSTPVSIAFNSGISEGSAIAWKEVGGAVNPTWSYTSATTFATKALSFTPPGGGAPPCFRSLLGVGCEQ